MATSAQTSDFLATGGGIDAMMHNGMTAVGLTEVQAHNFTSGYPGVYAFADSLQATQPIYIVCGWSAYVASPHPPQFWFTACTNYFTTSAINLGFDGVAAQQIYGFPGPNTVTTNLQNCYFSGASNRIQFAPFSGPDVTLSALMSVERTKDASGADTSEGMLVHFMQCTDNGISTPSNSNNNAVVSQVVPFTATVAAPNTHLIAPINQKNNTMTLGSDVGFQLPVPFNFYPYPPGLGVVVFSNSDFAAYTTASLTVYGSSHTYMALDLTGTGATNPQDLAHVMMLWE